MFMCNEDTANKLQLMFWIAGALQASSIEDTECTVMHVNSNHTITRQHGRAAGLIKRRNVNGIAEIRVETPLKGVRFTIGFDYADDESLHFKLADYKACQEHLFNFSEYDLLSIMSYSDISPVGKDEYTRVMHEAIRVIDKRASYSECQLGYVMQTICESLNQPCGIISTESQELVREVIREETQFFLR